jgi:hypothetical protein
MFGKLHFGNNPQGFDQFKILPGQGAYYNPEFITKHDGNIKVDGYVTDIVTDMTLDWLQKERNPDKPFMLMYLHKAPHRSWLMAERHLQDSPAQPEPHTFDGRNPASRSRDNILSTGWAETTKYFRKSWMNWYRRNRTW